MLTSELTDRKLLEWISERIGQRVQLLATLNADDTHLGYGHSDMVITRSSEIQELTSLRNNIKLGMRCVDGELNLGNRPWDERDEDTEGGKCVADKAAADARPDMLFWDVRFGVHACWIEDGFNMDEEQAKGMIESQIGYGTSSETSAKIINHPKPEDIRRLQGFEF